MIDRSDLSKMGIGTWGIGGFMEADPKNDDVGQADAMAYALNKGVNYVETVFMYAHGHAIDVLAQAIKKSKVKRDDIFITFSVYQRDAATIQEAKKRIDDFLRALEISSVDSIQFTMGLVNDLGLEAIEGLVNALIKEKKTRFTSLTNASPEFLKIYHKKFGNKLFAHEGVFNFEVRENETYGLTKYAQENNILNVIFQPLRRNSTATRKWPLLVELAKKYGKTQNQILLNWIVSKGFFPLVKSSSKKHIDENLEAFSFEIEPGDLQRLNSFKLPGYIPPKIDWYETGEGAKIHQLPNDFDQIYDEQLKHL
ncbi:MAG TPA: aldo/keto reductase [Candidatus Saccharimonadia bacterium]|nr:aldo/keto reductase [Candidatus Saccharimonadia bacterium]